MTNEPIFNEDDVIFKYTSEDAEDDGILFDVTKINPAWKNGTFNYVTANLLKEGYFNKKNGEETINIPNLLDLLNQSLQIVRIKTENFTKPDSFFDGHIELPNGNKQMIFIQANETGKFTIMLPEDY